jgi:hypothetical protein
VPGDRVAANSGRHITYSGGAAMTEDRPAVATISTALSAAL